MRAEDGLQIAVASYLDVALVRDAVWYHVPNGGSRSKAEAGRFKAMGVLSGVPDVTIHHAGRTYFIELKVPADRPILGRVRRAGVLNEGQKSFRTRIEAAGFPYVVCRSVWDVEETLRGWGLLR